MTYLIGFILVLSIVVFFHELGHYLVAKMCGVKIKEFSLGFGRELIGFNDKSGTRWKISLYPLGGYVKMEGDTDPASTGINSSLSPEELKETFYGQSLFKKSLIVAAGPIANFLLAIVILSGLFMNYGMITTSSKLFEVSKDGAAYTAGLRSGDTIIKIDGREIKGFSDIISVVSINLETPIKITFIRNGKELQTVVTPRKIHSTDQFGNKIDRPSLGVTAEPVKSEKLSLIPAINQSVKETYNIISITGKSLYQLVSGQRSTKDMSGPIGIAKYSGQAMELGLATFLSFVAMLSINLGVMNLLPVPVLDGGHLFFYAIEGIIRRPIPDRIKAICFKIGFYLIILLSIFVILNDILKMF